MTMARGPEGKIQDAVIKYARSKGLLCKKNEVGRYFVQSGWPDYMIFGRTQWSTDRPHVAFLEFKAPGGRLTVLQESVRKQLVAFGFSYYIVDDVAFGKKIIREEYGL